MARLKVGQKTANGASQQISTTPTETSYWVIKALATNLAPIEIGVDSVASGQGYLLEPGEALEYVAQRESGANVYDTELNQLFMLGASGDKLTWLAHQV